MKKASFIVSLGVSLLGSMAYANNANSVSVITPPPTISCDANHCDIDTDLYKLNTGPFAAGTYYFKKGSLDVAKNVIIYEYATLPSPWPDPKPSYILTIRTISPAPLANIYLPNDLSKTQWHTVNNGYICTRDNPDPNACQWAEFGISK